MGASLIAYKAAAEHLQRFEMKRFGLKSSRMWDRC